VDADIPLPARVIAVADTFDAMTTSRPYRQAMSGAQAAAEICDGAGSQFCPRVVSAFRCLFERGSFTLDAAEDVLRSLSQEAAQS
jgi:HD-GYP domain-containing protein (c-di-GMP phosphodiesterase class II)